MAELRAQNAGPGLIAASQTGNACMQCVELLETAGAAITEELLPILEEEAGTAANRLGEFGQRFAERVAGFAENTENILVGGLRFRRPDMLNVAANFLGEVKNTAYQYFSSQLRDFVTASMDLGLNFHLYLRVDTEISPALQQAANEGLLNIHYVLPSLETLGK